MSVLRTASSTARSNQSMECFRLLASFLVVFIHIPFPGAFGSAVNCIARCAVPGFFAISGFFSYGIDSRRLGRRIRSMLVLILAAFGVELLWNCVLIELEGGSSIGFLRAMIPTVREILDFFFLCLNPLRDSLWYLPAALEVLCVLWVYVRFFGDSPVNYRPLYIVSTCLFAGALVMGTPGQAAGFQVPVFLMRNGLFFGLPMFSMGLFLRQYHRQILENFSLNRGKLLLLTLAGFAVGLGEWFCIGICDMLLGTTFSTVCIILLSAEYPRITEKPGLSRIISTFGKLSVVIYIVHSLFIDVCERFLQPQPWLAPVLVLGMSLAAALAWERLTFLLRKK